MTSLRRQLVGFWIGLLVVCLGLGWTMWALFRSSAGAQIESMQSQAASACTTVAARYAKSLTGPAPAAPQLDLLQVVLQLVLADAAGVEGGVWRDGAGFLAYAYPTDDSAAVPSEAPVPEQPHLAELGRSAARTQQLQIDLTRSAREALVVAACPLASADHDLVAWTMARTAVGALDAQRGLRVGLAALLACVLASGLWLGTILVRGWRHVQRLEAQLADADGDADHAPLATTGVRELDRIVAALDSYRLRLAQAREQLRATERQRARDQRLAALGRMTGGVAHEIRNPIATMRLKAENALAGPPERQPAALQMIIGQIARLDALVQALLALVQPIQVRRTPVELGAWLAERVAAVAAGPAGGEGRRLPGIRLAPPARAIAADLDPIHLGRAVDNLLDNAVRHARTRVGVSALEGRDGMVRICVDDDGAGVDAAVAPQLFEPFVSGRPDGTGLGLALAREVALAHGGTLTHEPLAGGGTRFQLEWPWRAS